MITSSFNRDKYRYHMSTRAVSMDTPKAERDAAVCAWSKATGNPPHYAIAENIERAKRAGLGA